VKDKLLFWIEGLLHFGIAKSLMDKYDSKIYAIIDANSYTKQFFLEQKLVNFTKTWYYRDNILKKTGSPNINYLKSFEEKYKIHLWELIYSERFFFQFDYFYKFNEQEILSIIEQECIFYEKILDEIKPDFIVMPTTDYQHNHLFYLLCQAKKIKILMLNYARFGNLAILSSDYDKIDDINQISLNKNKKPKTEQELEDFRIKFNTRKIYAKKLDPELKLSIFKLIQISLRLFSLTFGKNYRNYYKNYGRTFFRLLRSSEFLPIFLIQRWRRNNFLNKHAQKNVDLSKPFVYYPLHVEPERTLSLSSPFYSNQYEIIKNVARSLPMGYRLLIKEHFGMNVKPWRKISDYKKYLECPNVTLIHPAIDPAILLTNCSILVTINGTSSVEAAFFKKPSIIFADVPYFELPFVHRIRNLEELPFLIRKCLKETYDFSVLADYIDTIIENSIHLKFHQLYIAMNVEFYQNGMIKDTKIDESKMKAFLEKHYGDFEILADEHIKKIKSSKAKISPKN